MKKVIFSLALTFAFIGISFAQESAPKFTVEISTDSVLMGNYFEVKFTLENADGSNFEAPHFENFDIVGGPNHSSSYSFVNGEMSQSITFSYYLQPRDIGAYYILPASIETKEAVLETIPLEVWVAPNPEGIQQFPKERESRRNFFDDFWNQNPFGEQMPAPEKPKRKEPVKPESKKKKRKTVRI